MGKNKKKIKGVMYSTNPNFEYEYDNEIEETLEPNKQKLKVYLDKNRSGKIAVIIKGFIGTDNDLKNLSKILKRKCGVGGSVKNKEIIIQGNIRNKVVEILEKIGYKYQLVGG